MPKFGEKTAHIDQESSASVPAGLFELIVLRIEAEQKLVALRRRFILLGMVSVVILVATVPVWQAFRADIISSGFGQYMSLLVSDFRTVAVNWQDFSLSLLETLPIVSTVELLGVVFILLFALKLGLQYMKDFWSARNILTHKL